MEMSHVYLLVFPMHRCFKIGKADDVDRRVLNFKWLGPIDGHRSFELTVPKHYVFDVERALKKELSDYAVWVGSGDGCTELFDIESLPAAVRFIQFSAHLFKKSLFKKRELNLNQIHATALASNPPKLSHHFKLTYAVLSKQGLQDYEHFYTRALIVVVSCLVKNQTKTIFNINCDEEGFSFAVRSDIAKCYSVLYLLQMLKIPYFASISSAEGYYLSTVGKDTDWVARHIAGTHKKNEFDQRTSTYQFWVTTEGLRTSKNAGLTNIFEMLLTEFICATWKNIHTQDNIKAWSSGEWIDRWPGQSHSNDLNIKELYY